MVNDTYLTVYIQKDGQTISIVGKVLKISNNVFLSKKNNNFINFFIKIKIIGIFLC